MLDSLDRSQGMTLQVNWSDLPAMVEELTDLLGRTFVETSLEPHSVLGKKIHEVRAIESRAHPLADAWQRLKSDVDASLKARNLRLSNSSIWTLRLLIALRTAKELNGFSRAHDFLLQRDHFYSARYEIEIASTYKTMGYDVEFLSEDSLGSLKQCDLLVSKGDEKVYVECKIIRNALRVESNFKSILQEKITSVLRRFKRSWAVNIQKIGYIRGTDIDPITDLVEQHARDNDPTSRTNVLGLEKMDLIEIAEWDELCRFVPTLSDEVNTSFTLQVRLIQGELFQKNHVLVQIDIYLEKDIFHKLTSDIKKAYKKFPDGHPSVLHVGIEDRDQNRISRSINSLMDPAFSYVNNNFSRMNAVALSATSIRQSHNE
jgi:hypothetical protein